MLPHGQRLTRGFQIVFRKGVKVQTPFFVIRAIPAFDGVTRIAVTVSKKAEKTAVGRNRVRRRIIEAVRDIDVSELPAMRIAFIAFSPSREGDFVELQSAVAVGIADAAAKVARLPQRQPKK